MILKRKCVDCDNEATNFWYGGQALCDIHRAEWEEKDRKLREVMKKELLGINVVEKDKKKSSSATSLFAFQ